MAKEAQPLKRDIKKMSISSDLKLLEVNAHFMRHEMFQTLVRNIRRDGGLTSVPFVALDPADGKYLVLSGNHRVKAAEEAGFDEIDVMYTDEDLPKARKLAIQLSHNALMGSDDPVLLQQQYEEIDDVDWREYSGLDDKALGLLQAVEVPKLAEAQLDFQTMTMMFLPAELERVAEVFERVRSLVTGDEAWLARIVEYERTLDALDTAGRSYGVKNAAVSLALVLDVVERHLTDFSDGWDGGDADEPKHRGWVPLRTIIGSDLVPAAAAMTIKRAVTRMREAGDVSDSNLWQALEYMAASFLAEEGGPE